jgi:hypothetical protein
MAWSSALIARDLACLFSLLFAQHQCQHVGRCDKLHHQHHEINTLAVQEQLFIFGFSESRAQRVEHVLHEFGFVAIRRIPLPIVLWDIQ